MTELNLIRDQSIMLIYAMLQCSKFNLWSILYLIYFIVLIFLHFI